MQTSAHQVTIVVPPQKRGDTQRELRTDMRNLTQQQKQTLAMLPRDRRGERPVLKGPPKTSTDPALLVQGAAGTPVVAQFKFGVPAMAIDIDVPAMLDVWHKRLELARVKVTAKEVKRAGRAAKTTAPTRPKEPGTAKPRNAAAKKTAPPQADARQVPPAGTAATQQADGTAIMDRTMAGDLGNLPGEDGALGLDELSTWMAGEGEGTEPQATPVAPTARQQPTLYTVLPTLPDIGMPCDPAVAQLNLLDCGVAPVGDAGTDTLREADLAWASLVRLDRFDASGWATSTLGQALDNTLGAGWYDPDRVEDIAGRVDQSTRRIEQAHAEYLHAIAEFAAARKPGSKGKKGQRGKDVAATGEAAGEGAAPSENTVASPTASGQATGGADKGGRAKRKFGPQVQPASTLATALQLVDEASIDLTAALHQANRILVDVEGHPDWALDYAQAVTSLENRLYADTTSPNLAERARLLLDWSTAVAAVQTNRQMSLWTGIEQKRLQKAIDPQIHRARRLAATDPTLVLAATFVLDLLQA